MAARDSSQITTTLTREKPPGWQGPVRRIDKGLLSNHGFGPETAPQIFVCGSNAFAEAASANLVELGYDPASVKTERFGPSR